MEIETNYYSILNVSKDVSVDEIKKSFRREILKWHPDRNKSSEATSRTKKVLEAWEILKDPEKRKAYDYFLTHQFEYSDELHKWQEQAQHTADENVQKRVKEILINVGVYLFAGTIFTFVGLVTVGYWVLVGILCITAGVWLTKLIIIGDFKGVYTGIYKFIWEELGLKNTNIFQKILFFWIFGGSLLAAIYVGITKITVFIRGLINKVKNKKV